MSDKPLLITKSHIEKLNAVSIAHDPAVSRQVISKMVLMYSWLGEAEATRWHEREKDNFSKLVSQSADLRACTQMSLYFAYMKAAALRLSFDNGRDAQGYLICGNRNIGTKAEPKWIKEAVFQPSPYGEKEVRINAGILKEVGDPQIVHKGDKYRVYNNEAGKKTVEWVQAEKKTTEIIGSFIRIVEPGGSVKYVTFDLNDVVRWQGASAKKNRDKGANELYTSGPGKQIDEGFFLAKTLLHSFKGYKRVDFAYKTDSSFVPDEGVKQTIDPSYLAEMIDTDFEEEQQSQLPEKVQDDFTQAIQEEEKPTVGVKAEIDEDDPFNAN